jgi:hypothetical protein
MQAFNPGVNMDVASVEVKFEMSDVIGMIQLVRDNDTNRSGHRQPELKTPLLVTTDLTAGRNGSEIWIAKIWKQTSGFEKNKAPKEFRCCFC